MPSDRTRTSDDLRERYKAVVMQQGRVILDRDWNVTLQGLSSRRTGEDSRRRGSMRLGPMARPTAAFAITLPETSFSTHAFSIDSAPAAWDFLIAPGTMYVGGQRCVVLPAAAPNQPPWSYFNQPDWLDPPGPTAFSEPSRSGSTNEYIYIHVYEQEVSAVEDSDLLDVALGGPDTTARRRLMWRVHRRQVDAADCATALGLLQAAWAMGGFQLDAPTMQLVPQAQLQVSFVTAAAANLCDPTAQGGYLGALNQLIRLQISDPGGSSPQLLWGYDDAEVFLYRVTRSCTRPTTCSLEPQPGSG